jgi:hypothetical protein
MIVRCDANKGSRLPEAYLNPAAGFTKQIEFDLAVGHDYVVYALAVRQGLVWYYLSGDVHPFYPVSYPAPLFSIVDNRLSRYWVFSYTPNHPDHEMLIAFQDWSVDRFFYDRLTDGAEAETATFARHKSLIDSEHTG